MVGRNRFFSFVGALPFLIAHLACIGAIWTGVSARDLLIAVGLYVVRMVGVTVGYHRYFSHRGFETSRVFGFVLAFIAQSSAQRGILWWAAKHRHHHRFSDTDDDVHSPVLRTFWYAHLGWIFAPQNRRTRFDDIRDFAKYPELLWLNRRPYLPAAVLAFAVWLCAGWSGLVVGFFWSTVALWHGTFAINSLAHVLGRKRYVTGDQSRNNWWLALLTCGEGWHNNHHHYQSSARQGFRWYEIDLSYYVLRGLAAVGLVWNLRIPPAHVIDDRRRIGRAVLDKAARQLAATFHAEGIVADVHAALAGRQEELARFVHACQDRVDDRLKAARQELIEVIHAVKPDSIPTLADLSERASAMFARTSSLNEIIDRARQILIDEIFRQLATPKSLIAR
jgi:stearoyl-CoA desaturase (delta-9 desaturase)